MLYVKVTKKSTRDQTEALFFTASFFAKLSWPGAANRPLLSSIQAAPLPTCLSALSMLLNVNQKAMNTSFYSFWVDPIVKWTIL